MQKKAMVVGVGFLIFFVGFSGCDELLEKPQHISVNIMVAVSIQYVDVHNALIQKNTDGMPITIVITRNGQNQLVFERIMQNGLCQATGDFELSEGSYIECTANVKNDNQIYTQITQGYAKLVWETVNASTNFAGVYNWYPKLIILLQE